MRQKQRVTARARVRVRLPVLLDEALERAGAFASRRAFKHRDQPIATAEELAAAIEEAVREGFWSALAELGVEIP